MNYWSLETSLLRSKAFASAPAAAVGTWLRLMGYAVEQELPGGVIEGLGNWDARELLMTIACEPQEVLAVCNARLAHFEDGDLHIHHFPAEEMAALHAKREGGKTGGRPRKAPDKTTPETMPETIPETIPLRIGKDRIGEERRGEGSAQGAASSHSSIPVPAEPSEDSWEGQHLANLKTADRIASAYKKPGGSQAVAIAAIVRALEAGEDPAAMLKAVEAHERYRSSLPRSVYHPGREKFFENESWRCRPADVFQTSPHQDPSEEAEKKSGAPPVPERRGPVAPPDWQDIYAEEMDVPASTAPHSWSLVPRDLQRRIVTAAERRAAA